MRRSILIGLTLAVFVAAALLAFLFTGQQTYTVKGRVAGFGSNNRALIVEHEEISGYMPAMTMTFKTSETTAVEQLERGQAVRFQYHISTDSSWITNIQKVADSLVAKHPAEQELELKLPKEKRILQPGDQLPEVTLVDQDSQQVQLADYRGQMLLLTFIYTRCPMPDFCPLMSKNLQAVHEQLPEELRREVQLLSVSFDTKHDTPATLKKYAKRYTNSTERWTFATGTPKQIGKLTARFGVFYSYQDVQEIKHNLVTVLVGPEGTVQKIWRGNDWQPEAVIEAVQGLSSDKSL